MPNFCGEDQLFEVRLLDLQLLADFGGFRYRTIFVDGKVTSTDWLNWYIVWCASLRWTPSFGQKNDRP